MTVGQKRRKQRDVAILEARRKGLSLRALAAISGLSASRIADLLEDLEAQNPPQKSERSKIFRSAPRPWN